MNLEQTPWDEKYRPQTIDEMILPKEIKQTAKDIIAKGHMPSLLFSGRSGIGKTTLAQAMANELGADFMKINASKEGNIDMIRTKLEQFASTVSFTGGKKITLLDEADGLTHQAQQALRGFVDEFGNNHTIIFTCNFESRISDAIKSRAPQIHFKIPNDERKEILTQYVKRTFEILDKEGVKYNKRAVMELVMKKFPDFRTILLALQTYSAGGEIDEGILVDMSDELFMELVTALKAKKFNDVRKWVGEHSDIEPQILFRTFYDTASDKIQPRGIPELILQLADFQHRAAFVADQEINTMAFLTSVMLSDAIQWK